jgi:hypothetical protein
MCVELVTKAGAQHSIELDANISPRALPPLTKPLEACLCPFYVVKPLLSPNQPKRGESFYFTTSLQEIIAHMFYSVKEISSQLGDRGESQFSVAKQLDTIGKTCSSLLITGKTHLFPAFFCAILNKVPNRSLPVRPLDADKRSVWNTNGWIQLP